MKREDFIKFISTHDQQWADVKGFIKENGSLVSYTLSKQLMISVDESDMNDREKKLINYFLMGLFTKVLFEIEEEIINGQ